jgi:uncharacterized membrane protein (UPF0127 family)
MKLVRVVNRTRGQVLATHAELADTTWRRFIGLMGRSQLAANSGLVLRPGGAIHMWFCRFPLDVLHVDTHGRVTHVLRGIKPWRMGPLRVGTGFTVELSEGAAEATQVGDEIVVEDVNVANGSERAGP